MSARIFATSNGGGEGGACAVTAPELIIRIAAARIANAVRMLVTPASGKSAKRAEIAVNFPALVEFRISKENIEML
jgi:hypothetical protein